MLTNKFLVMKWEWLEDSLNDEEIEVLYGLLNKASEDKPDYKYLVVNTDEPYAEKVQCIIENGKRKIGISKAEAIAVLQELAGLQDVEIAHAEADEALLMYLNDKDIQEAFEEVPRWYA